MSYEEIREKEQLISVHHKNIQVNAVEMFKVENSSPEISLNILFEETENYCNLKRIRYCETESLFSLREKTW